MAALTDREELLYRVARALDHSRQASEMQEAADEAVTTPENAASLHWDAAGLIEGVVVRLEALRGRHIFDAKRMDREQRREAATGVEFRAPKDAA